MMTAIRRLLDIGGAPVRHTSADRRQLIEVFGDTSGATLASLLCEKNGFYAFEGALHVLSDLGTTEEKGVIEWNRPEMWIRAYGGMAEGAVFFAEDLFGTQFCMRDGAIATFDPETGIFQSMAPDLAGWASNVLDDYSFWSGHKLAHEWQIAHGPVPAGVRLIPKLPFVLGGEFSLENLHPVEAVKGMRFRASIAEQIRDLPDGASVQLRVID